MKGTRLETRIAVLGWRSGILVPDIRKQRKQRIRPGDFAVEDGIREAVDAEIVYG